MTKYTFRTIVAPDQVRADFTVLRDQLGSSDKQLMQAMWNVCMRNIEEVGYEVQGLRELTARAKAEQREMKAAAKLKDVPSSQALIIV
jgi:hypothetical protein